MNGIRNSFWGSIPPVTKNLLIINIIVWLAMLIVPNKLGFDLESLGGLHYWSAGEFYPWQFLTYMFMHSTTSFAHLFFNMFTLWMFGRTLEWVLGSSRFLFFYITCGIGAGIIQELVWMVTWQPDLFHFVANNTGADMETVRQAYADGLLDKWQEVFLNKAYLTIGASGAIYGILLAFGMLFPNRPLYLFFIPVPIKAKWIVIGYGAIELLLGLGANDGVAHFAHLGGMIFGFLMIYYWKKKGVVHGDFY